MSRAGLELHLDGDCGEPCVYCDREEAREAWLADQVDSSEEQGEDEGLPASQADEGVTRP